jgi:para-nitrobenzyl esterase
MSNTTETVDVSVPCIVTTPAGTFRGAVRDAVRSWRGIRYAEAPSASAAGATRFRRPSRAVRSTPPRSVRPAPGAHARDRPGR